MARQYSQAITGVHIDAIYHTAIVLNNVEYFFGQGIHRKVPGSTHHGQPMSTVNLGRTDLPLDVIDEYIQSLEDIYTPESYDLFLHNCNNFTQDLAMFLVGKSIPEEIRTLPETFLRTPIGQMLRGQLDSSMRQMTQAPDAVAGQSVARNGPAITNGASGPSRRNGLTHRPSSMAIINAQSQPDTPGNVHNITSLSELDQLLESARESCAVIFFTSATCPPCKIVYPTYDELASEAGSVTGAKLIKIDIAASPPAQAVAQRYQIRSTPTFITFLKGQKQEQWSGANSPLLRGNVRMLLKMAKPHRHHHSKLRLPTFQHVVEKPIMYTRTPPLDKLLVKIGPKFSQDQSVRDLVDHIKAREAKGMNEAPLPNLHAFSDHLTATFTSLPQEAHFAVIDLVRVAAIDPRVSSFLATEPKHKTLATLVANIGSGQDGGFSSAPYNIQSVSLQLACNLFGSNVFQEQIFHHQHKQHTDTNTDIDLRQTVEIIASQCLLSPHLNARSMAAALVYNLAAYTHNERVQDTGSEQEEEETAPSDDLSAALLESITTISSLVRAIKSSTPANTNASSINAKEILHALLLALGMLLYAAPPDNMLWDLCRAMDLRQVLKGIKSHEPALTSEPLLIEVGEELLGKGGF